MGTIDQAALDKLRERIRREVEEGPLLSCQFALALDGEVVTFETYGDATDETRYVMFSATKVFVASVVWQLIAEGLLDPALPVTHWFPEFGANGKEAITLEQVMLHTSGFPYGPLGPPRWADRQLRREAMAGWRLNWEPGTRYEYHPTSAHWVLAELIDIVTGGDYRDELERRVTGPLGLGRVLGIPLDQQANIATLQVVGDNATPDELEATFGVRELPAGEVNDAVLTGFNDPENRAVGVPGGGGVARADQIVRFYQALLHNPGELWDPKVLQDAKTNVRNHLPDPLTRTPANRSLGMILAGDDGRSNFRGMGRTLSPMAFGHNGARGQIVWADPATGLSFACLTNGLDRNEVRQPRRDSAIASLAGVCATA
ncbi:MAG: serine hydrolase domain-containing protein [Acidimicrobiia bacterium]